MNTLKVILLMLFNFLFIYVLAYFTDKWKNKDENNHKEKIEYVETKNS